jgi:hypothetical protein
MLWSFVFDALLAGGVSLIFRLLSRYHRRNIGGKCRFSIQHTTQTPRLVGMQQVILVGCPRHPDLHSIRGLHRPQLATWSPIQQSTVASTTPRSLVEAHHSDTGERPVLSLSFRSSHQHPFRRCGSTPHNVVAMDCGCLLFDPSKSRSEFDHSKSVALPCIESVSLNSRSSLASQRFGV